MADKILSITQVKSGAGCLVKQQRTLQALGLRGIRHTVEHKDSPAVRGMIFVVKHLVTVTEKGENN